MSKVIPAALAAKPEDYKRIGVKPGAPAIWEDGLRTDGAAGSFEWWYFDSKLDDGSSLVIIFFTGPMNSKKTDGFEPHCNIELTRPDGKEYKYFLHVDMDKTMFSKDRCDIKMGDCYFRGDLHRYEIFFRNEEIEAKVELTGNAPAWRPHTGYIYFGEKDYFAWLPSVPEGTVQAMQYSAYIQNLIMSVMFLGLLEKRQSARGQSMLFAAAKWIGTLAPLGIVSMNYGTPEFQPLIIILGIFCSVFDIIYIYRLGKQIKKDKEAVLPF